MLLTLSSKVEHEGGKYFLYIVGEIKQTVMSRIYNDVELWIRNIQNY